MYYVKATECACCIEVLGSEPIISKKLWKALKLLTNCECECVHTRCLAATKSYYSNAGTNETAARMEVDEDGDIQNTARENGSLARGVLGCGDDFHEWKT